MPDAMIDLWAMNKRERYAQLVAKRERCFACQGLTNPSVVEGGVFDSNHIGPWSRWQGNLDAEVMVVGQDWGDVRYFVTHKGLEGPKNPTNTLLGELLCSIGIDIGEPDRDRGNDVAFFTNALLCLKQGGLQGPVKREWFSNCNRAFLRPLIEIIEPKVVVCLGECAWKCLADVYGATPGRFREAVESSTGIPLNGRTRAFAVYHCGARILNTHRNREEQLRDWERVGRHLAGVNDEASEGD